MPPKKKVEQARAEDYVADDSDMSVTSPLSIASTETTAPLSLTADLLQQILSSSQASMLAGQRALQQERLAYQQALAENQAKERLLQQQTLAKNQQALVDNQRALLADSQAVMADNHKALLADNQAAMAALMAFCLLRLLLHPRG